MGMEWLPALGYITVILQLFCTWSVWVSRHRQTKSWPYFVFGLNEPHRCASPPWIVLFNNCAGHCSSIWISSVNHTPRKVNFPASSNVIMLESHPMTVYRPFREAQQIKVGPFEETSLMQKHQGWLRRRRPQGWTSRWSSQLGRVVSPKNHFKPSLPEKCLWPQEWFVKGMAFQHIYIYIYIYILYNGLHNDNDDERSSTHANNVQKGGLRFSKVDDHQEYIVSMQHACLCHWMITKASLS